MFNGIINIYKEKGYTSHDVVAKIRGILKQKKVGHTGTLDPLATGVLPICLGSATKLCEMLSDRSKEYIADFTLGKETDTQDISGKVINSYNIDKEFYFNNKDEIIACIKSFEGTYMQTPPMYSAKKINGKKLVDLARMGIEIERKAVKIDIYKIDILNFSFPNIKIAVACSKGTYIRTLCHDIGKKLNIAACMTGLERIRVSNFLLKDSIKLDLLEDIKDKFEILDKYIIKVDNFFEEYPCLFVKENFYKQAINGNKLLTSQIKEKYLGADKFLKIYTHDKKFLGIYEYVPKEAILKPYKLFIGDV